MAMCVVVIAEETRGGAVVNLAESAPDFARVFDETCFKNRDQLEALCSITVEKGWKVYPGLFPHRHADSTAKIVWSFQENSVTYQLALIAFDASAPTLTCVLMSYTLDKVALPTRMQERLGLHASRKITTGEQDITVLEAAGYPILLVTCATATPKQVLVGQCGLVRPIRKVGFRNRAPRPSFGMALKHRVPVIDLGRRA